MTGAVPNVIRAKDRVDVASAMAKRKFVRAEMRSADVVATALADVKLVWAKLIRWTFEIARQVGDRFDVGAYSTLRVISTLQFLEHHLS